MTSCLDPKVATLSPALENRVLTGVALVTGASLLVGNSGLTSSLVDSVGLNGIEGLESLSDVVDGMPDLDSILAEGGTLGFLNAIVGGLAGLTNGWQVRSVSHRCQVSLIVIVHMSKLLQLLSFPQRNWLERRLNSMMM
jgi:hypothetical protein